MLRYARMQCHYANAPLQSNDGRLDEVYASNEIYLQRVFRNMPLRCTTMYTALREQPLRS